MRRLGLRYAEVAWLRVRDFHGIAECRLLLRTSKTRAGKRTLPVYLLLDRNEQNELLDFVREERDAARARGGGFDTPLIRAYDGLPFTARQLGAEITKVLKAAGVEMQTAHGLRHAFASSLLAAWWLKHTVREADGLAPQGHPFDWARRALAQFGRPEVEGRAVTHADDIRRLLGHADLEVTFERYVHVVDLIVADAVRLAEATGHSARLPLTTVARLAGTTPRAVRLKFSRELRGRTGEGNGSPSLDLVLVEAWLEKRLRAVRGRLARARR